MEVSHKQETFRENMQKLFNHLADDSNRDYGYVAGYLSSFITGLYVDVAMVDERAGRVMREAVEYRLKYLEKNA